MVFSISTDKKPLNPKTQKEDLKIILSPLLEDHFKTNKSTKELVAQMTKVDAAGPALVDENLAMALSFKEV